jgi:hypothetical protein
MEEIKRTLSFKEQEQIMLTCKKEVAKNDGFITEIADASGQKARLLKRWLDGSYRYSKELCGIAEMILKRMSN